MSILQRLTPQAMLKFNTAPNTLLKNDPFSLRFFNNSTPGTMASPPNNLTTYGLTLAFPRRAPRRSMGLSALLLLFTFHFPLSTASAAPNTWSTLAASPATVNPGGALVYPGSGDTIYAFGGNLTTNFWAYSIKNNTWTTMAAAPATVKFGGSLVYPGSGDTIYGFRGDAFTDFWAYSITNNTWTTRAAAPAVVEGGGSLVYPGSGDTIYAFRGNTSTNFWAYSITNNTWETKVAAPSPVNNGGALGYPGSGDTIYAFGGNGSTNFWAYSIKNNAWTTMAAAPAGVDFGGSLVHPGSGDTIYAFGGNLTTNFWAYSITNNIWETKAAAPASVNGGALVYPGSGDTIYAFRGNITTTFWGYTVPFYSGPTWYVNDGSTTGDTFTTAVGDTTGDGSSGRPFLTITKALTKAKPGDTIYIDAGLYTETVVINTDNIALIGKDSGATVIDPPGINSTAGLYGIYADTQVGLLIKTLGVTGAYDGILFDNVDNSRIESDSASECGNNGVFLRASSESNTITRNTTMSNTRGIYLDGSTNNTVTSNTANSNSANGMVIGSGSNTNTVTGNTASSNSTHGIYMSGSSNNMLTSNTASSNTQHGVYLSSSSNNTVVQNDLRNNTKYQVYIDFTSSSDTVQKNNIIPSGTNPDSGVYNASTVAGNIFTFTRNWWNTTDEDKIVNPGEVNIQPPAM